MKPWRIVKRVRLSGLTMAAMFPIVVYLLLGHLFPEQVDRIDTAPPIRWRGCQSRYRAGLRTILITSSPNKNS